MKNLIARITGRAPRTKFIRNAPSGSIVWARHEIRSKLGLTRPVPAATRGVLKTSIYRDHNAMVIVDWDGIGNSDALVSDLSPHFEFAFAVMPPRQTRASARQSGAHADLAAAVRAATSARRPSEQVAPQRRTAPAAPRPRTVQRTKTVIVREEPYDPSNPEHQRPPRATRPGETVHTEIIREEPI